MSMQFDLLYILTLQEFGNILLGISYLPTAQRLTIKVMKLRNVKFMPVVLNLNDFSEYFWCFKKNNYAVNWISISTYTPIYLPIIIYIHVYVYKLL
jgi:hypothetical protein